MTPAPSRTDPGSSALDHGGDLAAARQLFPDAPEPWIDLSTGINPQPYPLPPLQPEIFTRLPDRTRLAALEHAAARRYGAPAGAKLVATPGTQAAIQLLPHLTKARNVGILGFTYSEYARVWCNAGLAPQAVETLEGLRQCDIAILANPNNPDGRVVPAADLRDLAGHLARRGGLLIVDEAFIDLMPESASLVPAMPPAGTLVLRSFGKTYGLAGARLGFVVTEIAFAETLRAALGPWAVSGPAIEIGIAAFTDDAWLGALPARLARQAAIVDEALSRCGARLIGSTPLFRLFTHSQADELFMRFGRVGVLLRRFPQRPHWLRVGLVGQTLEARFKEAAAQVAAAM